MSNIAKVTSCSLQQGYNDLSSASVGYAAICAESVEIFQSRSSSEQISSTWPHPLTHNKLWACRRSLLPGLVMTYGFCTVLHLGVNYIMLQSVVKLSESSANAASTTNQFPLSCPVQRSRPQGHVTCCYYFSSHSSQQDTLQMQHVGPLLGEDFKLLDWWVSKTSTRISRNDHTTWIYQGNDCTYTCSDKNLD